MDAPYAKLEPVEAGIARVLAHNPSAFTYYGTQTYLLGTDEVAVIDPGPDLPEHLDALDAAIGGRPVVAILCTHTHRDHSPAARPLAERTGAPIIGCAPLALETAGRAPTRGSMAIIRPTGCSQDGEAIDVDGHARSSPSPPRATRRTICASLIEGALFTRRPCDGLVDDRGRPARRRHGRLHGEPRQAAAARRPDLLSGARPAGDQSAAICRGT